MGWIGGLHTHMDIDARLRLQHGLLPECGLPQPSGSWHGGFGGARNCEPSAGPDAADDDQRLQQYRRGHEHEPDQHHQYVFSLRYGDEDLWTTYLSLRCVAA